MNVQFQVYTNRTAFENRKCCFERIINLPDSVNYPFHSIIDCFRFLYGNNIHITFNID